MSQKKFVEKIKINISCSIIFSPENRGVYEIMWKNNVDTVRKLESMALARCMLDICGYKHTLRK